MAYDGICVKCGKCKGVCPTYQYTKREDLSPRGRMHLAELVDRGLSLNISYQAETCFLCGACEEVCPQRVRVREKVIELRARGFGVVLTNLKLGFIKFLSYQPKKRLLGRKSRVAFFPGCVYPAIDGKLVDKVAGYISGITGGVTVITGVCCGFPYRVYSKNYPFDEGLFEGYDYIVTICATCGSELKNRLGKDRVLDFIEFLYVNRDYFRSRYKGLGRFTFHYPCHLVRGIMSKKEVDRTIGYIAGSDYLPMEEPICCGFGSGNLTSLMDLATDRIIGMTKGSEFITVNCPSCNLSILRAKYRNATPVRVIHIGDIFE